MLPCISAALCCDRDLSEDLSQDQGCVLQQCLSCCPGLQAALLQADGGKLTAEMLSPLLRAVPEQKEISDIQLYLKVGDICHLVVLMSCLDSCNSAVITSKHTLYADVSMTSCQHD